MEIKESHNLKDMQHSPLGCEIAAQEVTKRSSKPNCQGTQLIVMYLSFKAILELFLFHDIVQYDLVSVTFVSLKHLRHHVHHGTISSNPTGWAG